MARKPKESAPDSDEAATLWVHSPAQGVKALPPGTSVKIPGSATGTVAGKKPLQSTVAMSGDSPVPKMGTSTIAMTGAPIPRPPSKSSPPPAPGSGPPPPIVHQPNPDAAPGSERTMILAPEAPGAWPSAPTGQVPISPPNAQNQGNPGTHAMQPIPGPPPTMQAGRQPMSTGPASPMMQPMTGQPMTGPNPMTGPVPAMPAGPPQPVRLFGPTDPRLILLNEPDAERAASYRLLRDNLLAKRLPRVFSITSASPKEGKTTCAINLALGLAERGARTMLIDGNLWEPTLQKVFSFDAAPPSPMNAAWLTPYKIAELSRNLHVAAVVVAPGETVPRFEKTWFEGLIGTLYRINYDFIIIDAPAISVSPLVTQLVAIAEGVLLAVKSGSTTARSLRRAADQLPPGKGLGLALIDSAPGR